MHFFDIDEMAARELAEGVKIRVIAGDRMTMVRFSLKKGALIPEHAHPHEQMGIVVTGKMKLVIDEKSQIVEPGSAWQIPSDVVHRGECLADETVVLECFSPPRKDLEKK